MNKNKRTVPRKKALESAGENGATVTLTADECAVLCKTAGIEYLEGYEERVIEYVITREGVDRDGDLILVSGAIIDRYVSNPVVLMAHDSRQTPVGSAIKVWVDVTAKEIRAWVLFADDRVDPSGESDRAYRFSKSRFMRAGSIGFLPIEYRQPSEEERKRLGMGKNGWLVEKWELLEFSVCPVPSNPSAVATALRKHLITPKDAAVLAAKAPTRAEVEAMIRDEISAAMKAPRAKSEEVAEVLSAVLEQLHTIEAEVEALLEQEQADEPEGEESDGNDDDENEDGKESGEGDENPEDEDDDAMDEIKARHDRARELLAR